jgi:precorrin-6B methylase 2
MKKPIMNQHRTWTAAGLLLGLTLMTLGGRGIAAEYQVYEPTIGQAGKDVVWVPTTPQLVEKMLDLAKVTPQDFVIDLGSGDGRNVIAAGKRGARALGVEYNPDMVELSRKLVKDAGVTERVTIVQGDMYEADISQATVMALFLLPSNLEKLKDKFLALKPGTRIVMNTFTVPGWQADVTEQLQDGCESWCTALLHIVPAKVAGRWRVDNGELVLGQEFQMLSGSLAAGGTTTAIAEGRMNGADITFTVAKTTYTGRVDGDRITGTATSGATKRPWTATRVSQ